MFGIQALKIKFFTDPWSEVSYKVNGNMDLISGAYVSVDIYVEPTKKKLLNRNRFLYILAEHPDIVWEIPILVTENTPNVFVPELVCLPKVPVNTFSNYQFIMFNALEKQISFSLSTIYDDITIRPISNNILAKNYSKVLISGKISNQIMTKSIVVTFNNGKSKTISVRMEPSNRLIYLSTTQVTFESTYIGLKDQQNVHICNKSMESLSFQWSCNEIIQNVAKNDADEELIVSEFLKIRCKRGCIPPMSSVLSIVTFCPPFDFDYNKEEEESPFKVNIPLYLFCPTVGAQSYRLNINATILGPNIEIDPTDVELGNIYMGQIQCILLNVTNKGPISGKICMKDHTDHKVIRCSLAPHSIELQPNSKGSFQLSFYRRDIGKFLSRLRFKVNCGNSLSVLLRGTSLAPKVKIRPEVFDFGDVPICIPQKRFAMVANPMPVPIVVEPTVVDDGVEEPIILCVDYSNLPLHARPASYYNIICCKSRFQIKDEEELKPSYTDFYSRSKGSATTSTFSLQSTMFQNKVLDEIPAMAEELLQNIKTLLPQQQPEPGMKIIDAALDYIVNRSDYFKDLKDKQNYLNMDWHILPSDAREVTIEAERFYLNPKESKSFPVIIIPNNTGPGRKIIQFKVCPMGVEQSDLKTAVRSKYLVNELRLQYRCIVPILECSNCITFSKPLYVDTENGFYMKFKNVDVVPGFVYFKVIPTSKNGEMNVKDSQKKFFIAPDDEVCVECSVIFRNVGNIVLQGLFQLIGKLIEFPFKVEAKVLPPKIEIKQEKMINMQRVLEPTRTRIFIENICPTVAQFSLSLKNEKYQFLEPLGGSLAPNQRILISLFSRYLDAGVYKNIIYIHLKHAERISIPITFIIEGAPLLFEPDVKLGLDFGNIFKNSGVQDHSITITNVGEKSYRLLFLRQKSKTDKLLPVAVFSIQPNGITLAPKAKGTITLSVDTIREAVVEEELSVDVMGEDNCRFKFFSFAAKFCVIKLKIIWSKCRVFLETGNTDMSCDRISDTVSLINTTPLRANVSLHVIGCFYIDDSVTGMKNKSLHFCLQGKETKELSVCLNDDEVKGGDICQCFNGFIKCKVNNKAQKHLQLHAKIVNPGLRICNPKVVVFSQNAASYSHIKIHNCSSLRALFTWKLKTLTLSKIVVPENPELLHSKTLSEKILSLSNQVVLRIPNFIKPQDPDVCIGDELLGEHDDNSTIKSSPTNSKNISKTSQPSSTNPSDVPISESAMKRCPLPEPTPSLQKQPINIDRLLNYLGHFTSDCQRLADINKDYQLDGGDMTKEEKSIHKFEEKNTIEFQENSGFILPKTTMKAYVFLPPVPEGNTIQAELDLEVNRGRTEYMEVTVAGIKGRVYVSDTIIDLGTQPWHRTITGKIKLINLCSYAVKITLIESKCTSGGDQHLINGHVEITSPKIFIMMPDARTNVEWKILIGLRYKFIEDIGLEVNNNTTAIPFRFHGKGISPMIAPVNLNQMTPNALENIKSFLAIRTVFEDIQSGRRSHQYHENTNIKHQPTIDDSKLTSSHAETKDLNISYQNQSRHNSSKNFVGLNYSKETGPEGQVIEQLIETCKFINDLNKSKKLRKELNQFYSSCLNTREIEFEPVINLKLTICRFMPWQLPTYILNIGEIYSNATKTLKFDLKFMGPGRVYLSARTQIAIPGLESWFEDSKIEGCPSSFVYFSQVPDKNILQIYKNVDERNINFENVCNEDIIPFSHAHSYDFDERATHQRKTPLEHVIQIKKHYTAISQPLKEKKSPLILAELCQTTDQNSDPSIFKLNLMFTAFSEFYKNDQLIKDYFLIDVHLGPTLPILLQGRVIKC